jgi:integrase/recombinase XerD
VDWTSEGHRIQKSLGIRDWQAAQRRARDMEADGIAMYLSGGNGNHCALTVQKATDDFLIDAKSHLEPSTQKQYRILFDKLNGFSKQRGYIFLRQLGVVQVREFRNSWTYAPRTAVKNLGSLKRFFSWCVENTWLKDSPAKPLKPPKVDATDVVPFSEEQIVKILKACDSYPGPNQPRLRILTDLMLATGLAIGDASMLSKSRVNVQGTTDVGESGSGWYVELRRAKTGTAVSVPIPNELAKSFQALDGQTPFWTGGSDLEHLTANWRKIYARVFKSAGVDGHPHQFRHTVAKRLLSAGVAVGHVATVLGNTETVCRRHYSKWIPERQEALERAIRATWGHKDR